MDRQLDAKGYDVSDDTGGRSARWSMAVVGVASAAVIAAAVGAVAVTRDGATDEQTNRAAQATVLTALGRQVKGGPSAVSAVTPWARKALDGTIGRPVGLAANGQDAIPARVLQSYRSAESTLAKESPDCRLPWWLVAGIGKVQSDHAAHGQVGASGTSTVRILGPRLDGSVVDGAIVRDTDKGGLDGDLIFDRGVGPMLLVPQTWRGIGRDGNGDGRVDASNSDDAALSVGTLLCSAQSDLTTPEGLAAGLVRFDDDPAFAQAVLPWAAYYRGTPSSTASSSAAPTSQGAPTTAVPTPDGAGSTTGPNGELAPVDPDAPSTTVLPLGPGFVTQPTTAPPSTNPPVVPPRPAATRTPRPGSPAAPGTRVPGPQHAPARPVNPAPGHPTAAPAPERPSDRPEPSEPPAPPTVDAPAPVPTPADPAPRPADPAPEAPTPERPAPPAETPRPTQNPQRPPSTPADPPRRDRSHKPEPTPRDRSGEQGPGRQGQGRSEKKSGPGDGNRGKGKGNGNGHGKGKNG